jgi:adenylate kinase family enzyme
MQRVAVIGCSAAGKSTLARQLGEKTALDVIYLDQLFWKKGCKLTPPDQEDAILQPLLHKSKWVMDGNYTESLPQRLRAADTVVLVDFSRLRCLARAMKRLIHFKGKARPEMSADCPEQLNFKFLKWIWQYPHKERPVLIELIRAYGYHANLITLRTQREIDRWLDSQAIRSQKKQDQKS